MDGMTLPRRTIQFRGQSSTSCVDAYDHLGADTGNVNVQKFDCGPTAAQNTTWGRAKTMFR